MRVGVGLVCVRVGVRARPGGARPAAGRAKPKRTPERLEPVDNLAQAEAVAGAARRLARLAVSVYLRLAQLLAVLERQRENVNGPAAVVGPVAAIATRVRARVRRSAPASLHRTRRRPSSASATPS